ncbi:MAG: hypothetical protein WBC40_04210 [Halobacteriota archaeon]
MVKMIELALELYKKKVLEREEIKDLVKAVEEKDKTWVKDFEEVFE